MSGRTSLKDIAAATGTSASTVSLALAGNLRVSLATRTRICEAAARLGYVRDPILASLASGRFRHAGKPVGIAISAEETPWIGRLRAQAAPLGMVIRELEGPVATLPAAALALGASALVLNRRGADLQHLATCALHIIAWGDEGPADPAVDVVEICEWWSATSGAVERIRAAGYQRPVAVLTPATPRHWHDDIRSACAHALGLPVIEWRSLADDAAVVALLAAHHADAVLAGMPHVQEVLQRATVQLPLAALIVHEDPWFSNITGWVSDQDHRGQVTLELIETRLRYGPRPPRRIIIPPRWQIGQTLARPG